MLDAVFGKTVCLVGFVIEANHESDSQFLKNGHIVLRAEQLVLSLQQNYSIFVDSLVIGRAKGDELVGNDPVQITILDSLVVLVLLQIELLIVEPAQLDGVVQTPQAVKQLSYYLGTVHL